jgi:prepilin-type N-terminal cleavage/methylation domain-containing protein
VNQRQTPGRPAGDEGFTLIEVIVALLVFAIVSTGIVAGMTTIVRMTGDNRSRITAANLASQELDTVRSITDTYTIESEPTEDIPVAGRTYHLTRNVSWISSAGADISCGSSTNLFYLRVNVRVTWDGMLGTTTGVQDDTILAPAGNISGTSTGAIGVSVIGATDDPQAGVAAVVTPTAGGKALAAQPSNTGDDGCTYANQVAPGTYDVTVSKTGWIDAEKQDTTATESVTVTAGHTESPAFPLYAKAATFTTKYTGAPVAYTSSFALPTNLETTWTNTSGTWTTTPTAASVKRFPYTSGYGVIAGLTESGSKTCAAVDPQAWSAGTSNGVALAAGARANAFVGAGQTATVAVPVGVVLVKAPAGSTLAATQSTSATGTPSCGISGAIYTYAAATTGNWMAVALPYGSWRFYYGSSTSNAQPVAASLLQVKTNTTGVVGVASDGTVTLDPRVKR